MPVQSKSITGREKKPPPTPRPKPILKNRRAAWAPAGSTEAGTGPAPRQSSSDQTSTSRFSLQLKPYVQGPQPFTHSPSSPTVQFVIDGVGPVRCSGVQPSSVGGGQVVQNGVSVGDSLAETDLSTTSDASLGRGPPQGQSYSRVGGIRTSFFGLEALQQYKEHTDWANEILRQKNLPPISDLRKSIADGLTLPAILKILSGVTVHHVRTSVCTKEERTQNLSKCLEFLGNHGADVSELSATELEDGNLKASLLLVGTVRKVFENSYTPSQNGHVDHVESGSSEEPVRSKPPPLPPRVMPGATKLAGAVPTPFTAGRETLQRTRQRLSTSPGRKNGNQSEEILPGVLGRDSTIPEQNSKPHSALISTTELGINGVAQHGVEERRQHLASTSPGPNRGGMVLRHPNAKGGAPVIQEMTMPQGVTRAWTASPRPQAQNGTSGGGGTIEDRLRQLITSNQNKAVGSQGRDNQDPYTTSGGGGGLFHGGGSEVFDDGDILIPPPPQSRNSPDFEIMMVGNNSYGPGYRHQGQTPRGHRSQGYVPSRPADRQQGARADALHASSARPPQGSHYQRQTSAPQTADMVPGAMHGQENLAFSGEGQGQHGNRAATGANRPGTLAKPAGQRRAGGNDLRNAWNKLYGRQQPQSGQVSPVPTPMSRGDNLRSSYGPESQRRIQQSPNLYRSKQPASQAHQYPGTRPVSAPAPAHMQVHFEGPGHIPGQGDRTSQEHLDSQGRASLNTSYHRESPMGQSSSTQGQLEESSSSQQSGNSQGQGQMSVMGHMQIHPGGDGYSKNISSPSLSPASPQSSTSQTFAIGPAAKYPENSSRPSSARKAPEPADIGRPPLKQGLQRGGWDESDRSALYKGHNSLHSKETDGKVKKNSRFANDLTTALQAASKVHHKSSGQLFDSSHNNSYDRLLYERSHDQSGENLEHSIFDYAASHSETSGSVTPPLPPLSPATTPPDSPVSENVSPLPRSFSATNVSSFEKLSELEYAKPALDKKKPRRTSELQFRMDRKPQSIKSSSKTSGYRTKGANLKEVRESDTDSDLSFDIENTILTVESHDTEQPHPAGDILTSHETAALRQQLHELEFKYHDLRSKVATNPGHAHGGGHHGHPQGPGPPPIGRQRRWSIGSSDTSSFRRESRLKPTKQIQHKHHSREFKGFLSKKSAIQKDASKPTQSEYYRNINKRFQRLESHVVTLARSVAHLSSELRTHNTMVNDLEGVKRELREVRDNPSRPFPRMLGSSLAEEERFRSWVPGLTNPKRVNKLTKFFGEEPPLLQLFLKKLGYERYVPNFESEHIGMIELPYMTEDRLEKIGVPMGPRLRILQEAQMCFKYENFNIYMV